jgi:hypothetical protein
MGDVYNGKTAQEGVRGIVPEGLGESTIEYQRVKEP